MSTSVSDVGTRRPRVDALVKVKGEARYAYEYPIEGIAYVFLVQSTIAKGSIVRINAHDATALHGVLTVVTHENAPLLQHAAGELAVMQSGHVSYHGQIVAAVIAETLDVARHAASLVRVTYEEEKHEVELDVDRPDLYTPHALNAGYPPDTFKGDVEAAMVFAAVKHEAVYTTPTMHNNPMEMHATIAHWRDDGLTLYDANQGPSRTAETIANLFGLPPERVRVIAPFVGGGFGSKANRMNAKIAAVMASRVAGRPVKVMLTRQQMFSLAGHRTPTHQRITVGAERSGKLIALSHETIEQSAAIEEFAEQTGVATRVMYGTPNLRTTHELATCDVPAPSWMRAPGECPGMFALESAIDETAIACGVDPVEFRIMNEPATRPEDDKPFSSRNVVACLREGARRIRWHERDAKPRARRDGRWLVGLGVASSIYPVYHQAGNAARVSTSGDGKYRVEIAASDIGQGAWTVLQQIAAEALDVAVDDVMLEIGDSALPPGSTAGGSSGTTSWGSAITEACREFRRQLRDEHGGQLPPGGLSVVVESSKDPEAERFAMYAFGAQFAEVRVDIDTGEIRAPRMCGIFAAGRILTPTTARSQFVGGMTMGLSMALHEETVIDSRFGDYANHDFAGYHIAVNADVHAIDVGWIDEKDAHVNAMGSKGVGEIGIVGTAAAIANAAYNATGIRVRDLPITLDKLLVSA